MTRLFCVRQSKASFRFFHAARCREGIPRRNSWLSCVDLQSETRRPALSALLPHRLLSPQVIPLGGRGCGSHAHFQWFSVCSWNQQTWKRSQRKTKSLRIRLKKTRFSMFAIDVLLTEQTETFSPLDVCPLPQKSDWPVSCNPPPPTASTHSDGNVSPLPPPPPSWD